MSGSKEEPTVAGRLDDRIILTLHELNGRIAFSGLRRALGAHPEALARSLRRLEREGLIEHAAGGYRALAPEMPAAPALTDDLRPLARVELPLGTTHDSVVGRLSGRWFGSLRWVGVIEGGRGPLLAWARRDGSGYVLLGVRAGRLEVFVPGDAGPGEAEDAAYEVLAHALEALRSGAPTTSTVALFRAETARPIGWALEN